VTLTRDVARAASESLDLIVVGGGVYGAMLLLQASRCGLRAVAVERDDFGGGTSWNHLRIVHGGLRYLQRFDRARHRESVAERRRFLQEFGDFVRPLPCWMPLDWSGLRNPVTMACAGHLDDWLSRGRNEGIAEQSQLPRARVYLGGQCERHCEGWGIAGSSAAFRWFDAFMPRPRRLLIEILHRACDAGGLALNYSEAVSLIVHDGSVLGVRVRDRVSHEEYELRAPLVVNASGPGGGLLTESGGREHAPPTPRTLAWNLLLDIHPAFDEALAVAAPRRGAPVHFLVPWEGRLLAGTGHAPAREDAGCEVPVETLSGFIDDLDRALPGLGIRGDRVLRVYRGYLPGIREGSAELASRPAITDHGLGAGPHGLWSVEGVKFTTARRVADETIAGATGRRPAACSPSDLEGKQARYDRLRFGPDWNPVSDPEGSSILQAMIRDEAVIHLDDLLLRRTSLGDDPRRARALAPQLAPWFGDDEATRNEEIDRVTRALEDARSPLD
jgi:glycerol-3-phosphate dehydrogenase